ncbi:MAG: ImmA/IrrE family metallo-endopeptidase [Limisphaerales bacterium]
MAAYFGLAIEYIDDPELKVQGFLDRSPEPRFIAIRRGLEPIEEEFTIAHELGHYVLHPDKRARKLSCFFWGLPLDLKVYKLFVRAHRMDIHRTLGCEAQADVLAIAALYRLGRFEELSRYVEGNLWLSRWLLLIRAVSIAKAFPRMLVASFLSFARSLVT